MLSKHVESPYSARLGHAGGCVSTVGRRRYAGYDGGLVTALLPVIVGC